MTPAPPRARAIRLPTADRAVLSGLIVVGRVKPWLLKGRMEVDGGLIFFALLGGMATFGPVGLVAGPLILSFFLAVVRLVRQEPRPAAA